MTERHRRPGGACAISALLRGRVIEVEHSGDRPDLVNMGPLATADQLLAVRGRGGAAMRGGERFLSRMPFWSSWQWFLTTSRQAGQRRALGMRPSLCRNSMVCQMRGSSRC